MDHKKKAMSFIEMVVCLTIVSICLLALIRGFGYWQTLSQRQLESDQLLVAVERLLLDLESQVPKEDSGSLTRDWIYETRIENETYVLEVRHRSRAEKYLFVVEEGGE